MWLNREKIDQTVEVAEDITEVAEVAEVIIQTEDIRIFIFILKERGLETGLFFYF